MLLSSFLYRRMRICKFQHAAGVCPNNAPAKPTRPHHRKLVLIHWLWIQYMFGHTTPLSCDCDG